MQTSEHGCSSTQALTGVEEDGNSTCDRFGFQGFVKVPARRYRDQRSRDPSRGSMRGQNDSSSSSSSSSCCPQDNKPGYDMRGPAKVDWVVGVPKG